MGRKKKAAASNTARPTYDIPYIHTAASRRWPDILADLGGLSRNVMNHRQHFPCPKCQGTDRFRVYADFEETGGVICNQCGRDCKTGFDTLIWLTGRKFAEVLGLVAEYLGIEPSNDHHKSNGQSGKHPSKVDPAEHLTFQDWDDGNDMLAAIWCTHKPPITVPAIKLCGGRIAHYKHFDTRYHVIALPVWGESLTAAKPVGWCLYNLAGGNLPGGEKGKWVKVKLTYGSTKPGIMGPVDQLATATEIWKLEGPSDLLAFYSIPDRPATAIAITNKAGAGEKPVEWIAKLTTDKPARILHDADEPGQAGAVLWAESFAQFSSETRIVRLPYEIKPDHGADFRDWINEGTASNERTDAEGVSGCDQQPALEAASTGSDTALQWSL